MTAIRKIKNGQGNIWWVIIGAAIAVIVLIILIMIFTGNISKTGEKISSLSSCKIKGGTCRNISTGGCLPTEGYLEDCSEGVVCCLPLNITG